jgi:hypothetical protein
MPARYATGIEVKISSENAAIVEGGRYSLAALLRLVADACEQRDYGVVRDDNGNEIGEWRLLWTDAEDLDAAEVE